MSVPSPQRIDAAGLAKEQRARFHSPEELPTLFEWLRLRKPSGATGAHNPAVCRLWTKRIAAYTQLNMSGRAASSWASLHP